MRFLFRKDVFENLGGFAPMWICEDFDFTYRLRNTQNRILTIKLYQFPFVSKLQPADLNNMAF